MVTVILPEPSGFSVVDTVVETLFAGFNNTLSLLAPTTVYCASRLSLIFSREAKKVTRLPQSGRLDSC